MPVLILHAAAVGQLSCYPVIHLAGSVDVDFADAVFVICRLVLRQLPFIIIMMLLYCTMVELWY